MPRMRLSRRDCSARARPLPPAPPKPAPPKPAAVRRSTGLKYGLVQWLYPSMAPTVTAAAIARCFRFMVLLIVVAIASASFIFRMGAIASTKRTSSNGIAAVAVVQVDPHANDGAHPVGNVISDRVGMTPCAPNLTYFEYEGENITCDAETSPHPMADCYSYPIDLWSRSVEAPNIPLRIFQIGFHKIGTRSLTGMAERLFNLPVAHYTFKNGRGKSALLQKSMEDRDCDTPLLTDANRFLFYSDFDKYGWKQLTFEYPGSLFILNIRSLSNWMASRAYHMNGWMLNYTLADHPKCQGGDTDASLSCIFGLWKRQWYEHYCATLSHFHGKPELRRNILLVDIENKQVPLSAVLKSFLGKYFVATNSTMNDERAGKTRRKKTPGRHPYLDAVDRFSKKSKSSLQMWEDKSGAVYQELDACHCVCGTLGYKHAYNLRDEFPNNMAEIDDKAIACPSDVTILNYLSDVMKTHLDYSLI